jgi:two-component system OmpR family response regulator
MDHTMASVLVVDDELDARDAVARFLKRAGHRVRCAGNGREALAVMSDDTPDVIILDAKMPEMDGVSFLEVIRCYLRWQSLPVIFVTAYPEGLHIRRGIELGVRKTFLKSNFELRDLLAHVEACAPATLADPETEAHAQDDFPDSFGRFN